MEASILTGQLLMAKQLSLMPSSSAKGRQSEALDQVTHITLVVACSGRQAPQSGHIEQVSLLPQVRQASDAFPHSCERHLAKSHTFLRTADHTTNHTRTYSGNERTASAS